MGRSGGVEKVECLVVSGEEGKLKEEGGCQPAKSANLVLGTRESANHVFHDLRRVIEMYRLVFLFNHCLVSSLFFTSILRRWLPPLLPLRRQHGVI